MRRFLPALLFFAAAAPACAADRAFPATGFDKVDLAAAATVDVHGGGGFAVQVSGDPALIDRLDVHVANGTLVIGWKPGSSSHDGKHVHVAVSMPRITGAAISGAGTINVDRADAPSFAANIRGAGSIHLPALHAQQVTLNMGGAGEIVAAGTAGRVEAHVNGVGSIDAAALIAHAGAFDMSGTGSIKAHVDGNADAHMSGMGSIRVFGKANCTTHKSGFGSVSCGD